MKVLGLAFAMLALAAAVACGAARPRPFQTADHVAALIRARWGATQGSPSFDYTCTGLDERGRLFTCFVRDSTDTVRLASFDVICDPRKCTWTDYPSYTG